VRVDVAIVGGGPAGQAAAELLVEAGLSVVVVDEQARPGGQILRQPPAGFAVANWLPGRAYRGVKAQLRRFEQLRGPHWLARHSVNGVFRQDDHFELSMSNPEGGAKLIARRLLVATGCYDLPLPLPGWTLPGVMSAGGVQAFIKSQLLVPGERFVLAGSHPLQLVVAAQIIASGGVVAELLFSQPRQALLGPVIDSPGTAMRNLSPLVAGASAYLQLLRAGVPVRFNAPVEEIEGNGSVSAVRWGGAGAATARCDRVALCYGFIPQSDIVRSLGAGVEAIPSTGGWAACHDLWMRSTIPGLYVAGETAGVGGAETALQEGRLAGLGIAMDAGAMKPGTAAARAGGLRRRRDRLRDFARLLDRLADPREVAQRHLPDDTILCRCEDVTAGMLRTALEGAATPSSPNALKLATRAGMGLCQGRGCEHVVSKMLARSSRRPAAVEGYTARFPVRPTPIGDLLV
jgi:D-hydroxyproline dehydrogenase subunit alpha